MKYFFAFFIFCVKVFAATYTVPGNYANINDALAIAQPGDTINVSGIHNYDINTVRAGTSGNSIVVDGGGTAEIRQMNFKHGYNTLKGFTIQGKNITYQAAVWFWQQAHYCRLENCVIDNQITSDFIGIGWKLGTGKPYSTAGDTASNCTVIGCTIKNVANTACLSICGDDNLIEGNTVIDGAEVDFIRLVGRRNIIRGNTFRNNYLHPGWSNHPDFIQCFGNDGYGSEDHIIESNIIDGVEGGGLSQLEANLTPEIGRWTLRNNIFKNISNTASCTIEGIKYYNNLFYRCNYGNGGHPLSFGSRYYEANRVDDSVPAKNLLVGNVTDDPLRQGNKVSGELVEGAYYTVYMLADEVVPSGSIQNGITYTVDGADEEGFITYNGVIYNWRDTFVGTSTASYTPSSALIVALRKNVGVIQSGGIENGVEYVVDGGSSGYITYNGVQYGRRKTFVGTSTTTFTASSTSMFVMKNGTISYNGVTMNHNTNFIATSNPNFSVIAHNPVVRRGIANKANGAQVIGNIFIECGDDRNSRGWYGIGTELTSVAADYNYVAKANFGAVAVDPLQRDIGGAVPWDAQGLKWWEDHGILGNGSDPGFVSYSTFDWRLTAGSTLIDSGTTISGLSVDRLGVTRPQGSAFDIGPHEYNSGSPPPSLPPAAPSSLAAIAIGTSSIQLSWTDNSNDEDYFTIERSLNGTVWFQPQTIQINSSGFDVTGLQDNTTYYFRLRAGNAYGVSSWTSTASATTEAILPPIATTPTLTLAWDANSSTEQVSSYRVYERTGQGPVYSYNLIGETTRLYMSITPVRGANAWVVRAVNNIAAGPYSDPATYFVQGRKSRRPRGSSPVPLNLK